MLAQTKLNIRGPRLYQVVARGIVRGIFDKEFSVGESLPNEQALTARFEVSRTVIREATQALAQADVCEIRHGAGTYIMPLKCWNLLDPILLSALEGSGTVTAFASSLLEVRRAIEGEAASLASLRATPDDIAALEALHVRMEASDITAESYLDDDAKFHQRIVTISGNVILDRISGSIFRLLRDLMATMDKSDERFRWSSNNEHQLIISAIKRGSSERARTAILSHLQGLENYLEATEQSGQLKRSNDAY